MTRFIRGLRHRAATSGPPTEHAGFSVDLLGQRLATKTVNFDDPGTHHLRTATTRFAQLSGSCFLEALPESRSLSTRPDPR